MEKRYEDAAKFVEAADVKGMFLYRKDGMVMSYIKIEPFDIELKSRQEREALTSALVAGFMDERRDFVYFTLPREVDLDKYKQTLKQNYSESDNLGKRHILSKMMATCAVLSTSGENYEHQHFIKIWTQGNRKNAEDILIDRLDTIRSAYANAGIQTQILRDEEIVKVCNLFGNSLQSVYDTVDQYSYEDIMQL